MRLGEFGEVLGRREALDRQRQYGVRIGVAIGRAVELRQRQRGAQFELCDQARHGDFANRFDQDPRATAEICDALTLWVLGRIDEALPLADRALTHAESAERWTRPPAPVRRYAKTR